jgi:hypothetical protein
LDKHSELVDISVLFFTRGPDIGKKRFYKKPTSHTAIVPSTQCNYCRVRHINLASSTEQISSPLLNELVASESALIYLIGTPATLKINLL